MPDPVAERPVAIDVLPTHEHLAAALADMGVAGHVVEVVRHTFDYDERGEPASYEDVGRALHQPPATVHMFLTIGMRRVGGNEAALAGLADPYPAALVRTIDTDNGNCLPDELPPRRPLLGVIQGTVRFVEPTADTADTKQARPAKGRPRGGRRKPDADSRTATDDGEEVPSADDLDDDVDVDKDLDELEVEMEAQPGGGGDSVAAYLKQIGKVKLLNAEQEVELAKRIEAGLYAKHLLDARAGSGVGPMGVQRVRDLRTIVRQGERAKGHMVEANLRLVVSRAKRYRGRGMEFLDVIQEGNFGLVRAVEKFDYTKGYKFSTYATWWINQGILRGLANKARAVRLPVHIVEQVSRLKRFQRDYTQEHAEDPSDDWLAGKLDITPEKVIELKAYGRRPISIDDTIGNEGDTTVKDLLDIDDSGMVTPDESAQHVAMVDAVRALVASLPDERDRGVISHRYGLIDGEPKTLDEIGRIFGVSRERIRQLESEIMKKFRHPSRSDRARGLL